MESVEILCGTCGRRWSYKRSTRKGRLRGTCGACASNRRMYRTKARAVAYKGGGCFICRYSKCPAAMEFHHVVAGHKDFAISSKYGRGWGRLAAELDKCVLLCSNCHKEVHAGFVTLPAGAEGHFDPQVVFNDGHPLLPQKIRRKCGNCRKPIEVEPAHARRFQRVFCGLGCMSKAHEKAAWPSDQRLGEIVWTIPVQRVGTSLGVSGSAVRKRCLRRGIQVPPRGYWAKAGAQPIWALSSTGRAASL